MPETSPVVRPDPYRAANWIRLALTIAWIGSAICLLAVGERSASFSQLRQDVRAGRVHEVTVSGEKVPTGADQVSGWLTQEVHWRDRWHVRRVAEVRITL